MPSKSKAQARLMNAVKHNKKFAKKVGIPQSVGADYSVGGVIYKKLPEKKKKA